MHRTSLPGRAAARTAARARLHAPRPSSAIFGGNLPKINHVALKSHGCVGGVGTGAGAPMSRSSHPHYRHHGVYVRGEGAPPARRMTSGEYSFGRGARQIRFGPVAFWSIAGALVIMATWSLMSATYFAFRDDVLARLIARQAHMQYAYEDRIADLRTQVDRLASRQLLDQEQFEQKLDGLMRRQSVLESRAAVLSALPDPTATGSTKPPRVGNAGERTSAVPVRPAPINDTVILVPPAEREAQLESLPQPFAAAGAGSKAKGIEAALARLEISLNRVEARQSATLTGLEESYDSKARRMRNVLADLGIDAGGAPKTQAAGGPFVPAKLSQASAFERQLYRVQSARSQVDALTSTLVSVPVRKPMLGEIDMTSGFGVRLDPFVHAAAMHTGIDFRGEEGEPIRATATGTVTHASWNGGYGRMVEVDHGNGLATRYAHLSAIDVKVGEKIRAGQVVGRLGSTGRSTGPHLHYETRVDGEAVDPQKFLRAGLRLGNAL
jgi:murein DD-endopeptidase MepM/ murein hydrolase activator NlpD